MGFKNTTFVNSSAINANNTSTEEEYDLDLYWHWQVYKYCSYFIMTVTIVTFLYALASWIFIRKWRIFKNYVYIHISAAAFLKNITEFILNVRYLNSDTNYYKACYNAYVLFAFAYNFWLFMLCVLFYSSIVKIFQTPVNGRFWKSASLGWGVPTVLVAMSCLGLNILTPRFDFVNFTIVSVSALIGLVTFVMYMVVLWALLKKSDVRSSRRHTCLKIQMATLLLLMSGVASVAFHFLDMLISARGLLVLMIDNIDMLPSIVVAMWVFASESNRALWRDYYRFRKSIKTATVDL